MSKVLGGDPVWASRMLQYVPDLGAHRDALFEKAAKSPAAALHTLRFVADLGDHQATLVEAAGRDAVSLGNIAAIHLKDSGGFDCQFTLYWTNSGNKQPKTGYGNGDGWKWSSTLLLGQSQTMACRNFALQDAPLEDGDEVWVYVSVKGGKDAESTLRFTYDSTTVNCADFVISGTTTDNTLAYSQMSTAAPMVKVSITNGVASYSPDDIVVHRSSDTGVQWQMETAGYAFTGVSITSDTDHDFGEPAFNADRTVMTVTDTVTDLDEYSYTVSFENTATGEKGSFDPGIKNMQ